MSPATIKAIVLAIIAAACFGGGWMVEGWRKDAEIAAIERAYLERSAADLQQHLDDMTEAEALGKALMERVAAAETSLDQITQEKNDAIRRLTAGRRCLDSAAVRVLNDAPGIKPAGLSAAASQPLPADAAFATDTDVGLWVSQCRRSYDTCRGRLEAIANFYEETE